MGALRLQELLKCPCRFYRSRVTGKNRSHALQDSKQILWPVMNPDDRFLCTDLTVSEDGAIGKLSIGKEPAICQ